MTGAVVVIVVFVLGMVALMAWSSAVRQEILQDEIFVNSVNGQDTVKLLEADVSSPLATLVRQAEMVAEEEYRQKHGLPMVTDFSSCINCGRTAIYVAGRAEPVAWVQTDPCPQHPRS